MKKKSWPFKGANRNSREFIDMDYVYKLPEVEREWLANFIEAEYHANREAGEKIKGAKLTKKEISRMDKINNDRRKDVYNGHIDASTTAEKSLNRLSDSSSGEIPDSSTEEREE
jgi:hypothetical protein